MKIIYLLFVCSLLSAQATLITLDELQWNKRIIITLTNDPNLNHKVHEHLNKNKARINERDIMYFLIDPSSVLTNSTFYLSLHDQAELIQKFFHAKDDIKILLIGKDGGVKMEKKEFDLEYIFGLIDTMPMRQQEMRRK